jgi:hypothetical protein
VESSAGTAPRAAARPRVGAGELIAGGCGLLLIVSMLLPWYGRETNIAGAVVTESWTAWQSLSVVAVLLFAIGVTAIAVPIGRLIWAAPERFRDDRMLVVLGLLGVLLVLFRMIVVPIASIDLHPGDSADTSRGIGIFLALLANAGIAYGGRRAAHADPQPRRSTRTAARVADRAAPPA